MRQLHYSDLDKIQTRTLYLQSFQNPKISYYFTDNLLGSEKLAWHYNFASEKIVSGKLRQEHLTIQQKIFIRKFTILNEGLKVRVIKLLLDEYAHYSPRDK